MASFVPLKSLLEFSPTGHAVIIRKLSPNALLVYIYMYSLCYKGFAFRRMRSISYIYIVNELDRLYHLKLTPRQVRRYVDRIVALGLLERRTTSFLRRYGSSLLPTRTSYYRISAP